MTNEEFYQRVEDLGIESYDTSMPIDWMMKAKSLDSKFTPYGNIVWCYDDYSDGRPNILGYPVAVTEHGREILGCLANWAANRIKTFNEK